MLGNGVGEREGRREVRVYRYVRCDLVFFLYHSRESYCLCFALPQTGM